MSTYHKTIGPSAWICVGLVASSSYIEPSQLATDEASFRTSILSRRSGRHSKRLAGRLTRNCLVSLPKDLGVQITAIHLTRFDVCGSFQVLVWRPTHLSDADNYLEQSRGKIVRWRNMEISRSHSRFCPMTRLLLGAFVWLI